MSDRREIEVIVNESGNTFHCRVANYLRGKGWYTLISPYYMDSATGKPREIDLIAEKSWYVGEQFFNEKHGFIIIKLFVECKYISQPNVFWFSDKDVASAKQWVATNTPLRGDDYSISKHHYLAKPKVAKLFASRNRPNTEGEVIYRALNQSLNAVVSMRWKGSINQEFRGQGMPVFATVEMPTILCNSFADFYRVEIDDPDQPKPIDDNFELEVNYAYLDDQKNNKTEYFLIDIVDFEKLDGFLSILEADVAAILSILRFRR